MSEDELDRVPSSTSPDRPDAPEQPVPDVTPAGPETPTVPDVPPGPDVPDVPPIEPEPVPDPGENPAGGVRAPTIEEITGYTADGVPTFDSVREKIDQRSATALGAEELARVTGPGRTLDEQYEDRKAAAADRLAEIRRSLRSE
ncbi:hypothetical protein [Rhodococcus sp. NPDC047139]|uniref:PspA/IM30 family protein n=1 Tax=Rhodococcus sp. NPDC047139 TaxID=3155141 RepID=UPI0033E38D9D